MFHNHKIIRIPFCSVLLDWNRRKLQWHFNHGINGKTYLVWNMVFKSRFCWSNKLTFECWIVGVKTSPRHDKLKRKEQNKLDIIFNYLNIILLHPTFCVFRNFIFVLFTFLVTNIFHKIRTHFSRVCVLPTVVFEQNGIINWEYDYFVKRTIYRNEELKR